ncbi:UPF0158 family protein [Arthrobacter sp. LAPM80]|uniref:UPF0158 family protein n=1 Tax=Arthrobacter sp. LAPM80 TaxID=3141788 RepID=UPI00398BA503
MLHISDVNLEDLATALDTNFMDYDTFFWLDPATGGIQLWGEETADEAEAEGWDVDERGGIRIEAVGSHEGYRDMEAFIAGVEDSRCREDLERSIDRSHPFRHFKDVLHHYPDVSKAWYTFHDATMQRRAVEWLRDNLQIAPDEAAAALLHGVHSEHSQEPGSGGPTP